MTQKVTLVFDENKFRQHCQDSGLDETQIAQSHALLFPAQTPMTKKIKQAIEHQNTNKK